MRFETTSNSDLIIIEGTKIGQEVGEWRMLEKYKDIMAWEFNLLKTISSQLQDSQVTSVINKIACAKIHTKMCLDIWSSNCSKPKESTHYVLKNLSMIRLFLFQCLLYLSNSFIHVHGTFWLVSLLSSLDPTLHPLSFFLPVSLFPSLLSLYFVFELTRFDQDHLEDHGFKTNHCRLVGSAVGM